MKNIRTIRWLGAALMTIVSLAAGTTLAVAQRVHVLGSDQRAWLGFSYDAEVQLRRAEGIVVREVVEDSPADQAGLEVGDSILSINGLTASEPLMSSLGYSLAAGDTVTLRIRRDGQTRDLRVVAADRPERYSLGTRHRIITNLMNDTLQSRIRILMDSALAQVDSIHLPHVYVDRLWPDSVRHMWRDSVWVHIDPDTFTVHMDSVWSRLEPQLKAMRLRLDSTGRLLRQWNPSFSFDRRFPFADSTGRGQTLHVPQMRGFVWMGERAVAGAELTDLDSDLGSYFGTDHGVLVLHVPERTPAARAGLEPGDVIVSVDGKDVHSIDELRRAIARYGTDESARIEVVRKQERVTLELPRD